MGFLQFFLSKDKKLSDLGLRYDFIFSTGRTGTNFFENFFNENFNQIQAWHEPKPDFFDLSVKYHRYGVDSKAASHAIWKGRRKQVKKAQKEGKIHFIESNPFLSTLLPVLKGNKGSKFLHLVRHPKDYIRSAIQKDPNNSGNFFMTDQDHRSRLNADDFPGDPFYGQWHKLNQFERICWNWVFTNEFIYREAQGIPNYKMVKFERLFKEPDAETWEELLDFFEIAEGRPSGKSIVENQLLEKSNRTEKRKDFDFESVMKKNQDFYNQLLTEDLLEKFGYSK